MANLAMLATACTVFEKVALQKSVELEIWIEDQLRSIWREKAVYLPSAVTGCGSWNAL